MTRTQYALAFFSCLIFPFLCAVACFFTAASGKQFPVSIGLLGIPCLMVGMLASQVIGVFRAYEKRIAELERRLDENRRQGN